MVENDRGGQSGRHRFRGGIGGGAVVGLLALCGATASHILTAGTKGLTFALAPEALAAAVRRALDEV